MEISYFQKTEFCDFDHPDVSNLAKKLANGLTTPEMKIDAVFKHVRDNIRFGFDLVQVKASETLAKGYGACWNKALLMVALLRCNNIPARMAYNPVDRDFMRPAMGEACQSLQATINHCFVQVQLDNKWVTVDATLDTRTYQKLFAPLEVDWDIVWSGKQDMKLYTEHITGSVEGIEDIDAAIYKDVGNVMPPPSGAHIFFEPLNQQMWAVVAA